MIPALILQDAGRLLLQSGGGLLLQNSSDPNIITGSVATAEYVPTLTVIEQAYGLLTAEYAPC